VAELLLVRHGETEWTLSRRHTSYTDLPLTANGEAQARAIAAVLARHAITLALTSPLRRARRTAELAGLRHAQVEINLHEWDYGGYEGLTSSEIRGMRPGWALWADGVASGPSHHPGESPRQVGTRADRVLARIRPLLTALTRVTSSWWRTATSCASSPPGTLACRPRPEPCSASIPELSARSAPSTAGR